MNMDDKIWNNGKDHFIEDANWIEGATTKLPKGTELIRYSNSEGKTTGFYFASETGKWIQYK